MVCSFCRRKDHCRATCNVRPLGNNDIRQCTVQRCVHCACNVRSLGNDGGCQCVGRPGLETTFASGSCNVQAPTKNSSTRHFGESGNHLLCPALHSTNALSYRNLRPPVKSDDCRIAGVIDLVDTLGSTFAGSCYSSRPSATDKKRRTGRVFMSEFSGLNLDLTLGGPYLNSRVPSLGKEDNEVADAPAGMRLQHPPTTASSTHSASANNHIETDPGSGSGPIYRDGRWSTEEHARFMRGLKAEGKGRWKQISEQYVKTRTAAQVNSHAQKHFLRHKNQDPKRRSENDKRNEEESGPNSSR